MFVIWWGERVERRKIGHAALFCPLCRRISAFEVMEVVTASHVRARRRLRDDMSRTGWPEYAATAIEDRACMLSTGD